MRLLHSPRSPEEAQTRDGPQTGSARPAARFVGHVLEMCVVMCVGGGLLSLLFFGTAALIGYSDLKQTAPEIAILAIAVALAASMVAWMRFRGMEWRPTLEMAGSTMVVGLLMIVASWLELASTTALIQMECGLACLAMIAVMLFRVPLYSGHAVHRAHAG